MQPTPWKAKSKVNIDLPTENAKDKVEHEEGPDDNERHEESPVEHVPNGIVGLEKTQGHTIHVYIKCFLHR